MVFWAALPILLFLFIWGLQKRSFIAGIIFGIATYIFSYAFTSYVFNFLMWLLLAFTWLFFILAFRKKEFTFFAIKYILLTLSFFILVHAWWIIPTFQFVQSENTAKELSLFITTEGNLYTLNILSRKLGNLIDILRFMHRGFYQGEGPAWSAAFNTFLPGLILFGFTGTILWVIYQLRSKLSVLYLTIIFFFGLYIAKGSNQPFGEVFQYFFTRLSVLQILRDPFEKIGFITALVSAPLFAAGVSQLGEYSKKAVLIIFSVFFLLVLAVLGFPFFSGLVFTSVTPPNNNYKVGFQVKVPSYYKEADTWLQRQGKNFRFISLPLGDEGMTYKWEKGYQGIEPSEILFSTPNISFNTTIPYYSQVVEGLEKLFVREPDFSKVANLLNVKFLLTRSDIDIRERRLRDPQVIEKLLAEREEEGSFKKVAQFEKLKLWENTSWADRTVYAANKPIFTFPQSKISDVLWGNEHYDVLLSTDTRKEIDSMSVVTILYPEEEKKETLIDEIPSFEHKKEYKINAEKDADYELILDNVILEANEASIAANIKVIVDDKIALQKGQIQNNKISYGLFNFSPGQHKIIIERPVTENLLSVPRDLIISTNQDKKISYEINNFDPYGKYFIQFNYIISSGSDFTFIFNQSNDMVRNNNLVLQAPNFNLLTKGKNSTSFIFAKGGFNAQRSEGANAMFWANSVMPTEIILKNLSVNRLIDPLPILISQNSLLDSPLPKITYIKHNPTKYSIQIKAADKPFILVLSELFNSSWEATLDDGTRINKHFLANTYANGWLVERSGDFNLTLEFAPQRVLEAGKIVSFLSLAAGLVYIIVRKLLWR